MLTVKKIEIYSRYSVDVDAWARNNSKIEFSIISDEDWSLRDGFIQDLTLVINGLASSEFNSSLNDRLKENCDTEETINKIKKIVTTQVV